MVRKIAKALALTQRERTQAVRALVWLVAAAACLRLMKYSTVRRALTRIPPRLAVGDPMSPCECERALERASRLLPPTACLTQALAGACLLRRDGLDSTLTIGVRLDPDDHFHAHAWLESDSVIVTGGFGRTDHRVLLRDVVHIAPRPQRL